LGGKGGAAIHFEKENSAFSNAELKTHILVIHAMTQVSQGILSTIVATACIVINAVE